MRMKTPRTESKNKKRHIPTAWLIAVGLVMDIAGALLLGFGAWSLFTGISWAPTLFFLAAILMIPGVFIFIRGLFKRLDTALDVTSGHE